MWICKSTSFYINQYRPKKYNIQYAKYCLCPNHSATWHKYDESRLYPNFFKMCCTCWRALFGRSVYISTITQQFISALPSTYSTEPFMSFDFSYGTHLQRHHRSFVVHYYATQNVTVTGLKPEYFRALTLLVGWREGHPVCKKRNLNQ